MSMSSGNSFEFGINGGSGWGWKGWGRNKKLPIKISIKKFNMTFFMH